MTGSYDPTFSNKVKYRKSTSFKIEFPTMPALQKTPKEVTLYQKQGHHDILVMQFSQTGPLWFDGIPTGLPMRFSWTQSNVTKDWYGYVAYMSKTVTARDNKEMEVHCIGTSFPLKERANRVFTNTTIPDVVAIIAQENGFNFIGDPHPRVYPQITIAGHSYWEWIQEQAKNIGYAAVMDGINLVFRNLDSVIDQNSGDIATLSLSNTEVPSGRDLLDRTLDYFKVLKGDYLENGVDYRTVKSSGGIDPLTEVAFTSSQSPMDVGTNLRAFSNKVLFSEYRSDKVIDSEGYASIMAAGAAQLGRMTTPAKAFGQGDYRIKPYSTVHIDGTGDLTDGYWLVKEVVHSFQKFGRYSTEVVLVTDGTGENVSTNFRTKLPTTVGMVNISEAISRGGTLASMLHNSTPVLREYSAAILPSDLGWSSAPSRWVSTTPRKW
jgi:phage protein D